jgi:4-amino-4-deoxy-L-arabinose transferase-like glycosyltransferase
MQPVGLQEWIHKLEEGEGVKYIRFGLVVLALLGLAALWHIREAKNFNTLEAMDAAQLARNIADGQGYTTDFVRPFSIALIEKHRGGAPSPETLTKAHPDLANPPLYPVLLAGVLKILPVRWDITEQFFSRYQPEWFIGLFNQLLFFASLFLVYRIAARLFDKAVGFTAVVLMALTDMFWQFTTSGLSTMLLITLCLWLVNVLITIEIGAREGQKSKGWLIGMAAYAGGIVGLMALTRYSMGWMILPVAVFLAATVAPVRGGVAAVAVFVFAIFLGPWLARNYSVSGTLFGTAGYAIHQETSAFSGFVMERSLPENIQLALNQVELSQYPRKLFVNGRDILTEELPSAAGNWIAALFFGALLIPFRNVTLGRLKFFIAGTMLLFVIVQALGKTALSTAVPRYNSENLLVVFTPLFFIFGAGLFFILIDQIEFPAAWQRSVAIGGFVILMSLPLVLRLLPPRNIPIDYPPYYPPYVQMVSDFLEPGELMMSDMPWAVAWYGNQQCIWNTLDVGTKPNDDFYKINDDRKAVRGLYLTELTTNRRFLKEMRQGKEGAWSNFYLDVLVMNNLPNGFPLKTAPPGMLPDQLFLSDRIRWR